MQDKEILQGSYSPSDEKEIDILKGSLNDELTSDGKCEQEKLSPYSLKKYISENVEKSSNSDDCDDRHNWHKHNGNSLYAVFLSNNTFFIGTELKFLFDESIYFFESLSGKVLLIEKFNDTGKYSWNSGKFQVCGQEAFSASLFQVVPSTFSNKLGDFKYKILRDITDIVNEYLAMHPTFYEDVFGKSATNSEGSKGKTLQKTTKN